MLRLIQKHKTLAALAVTLCTVLLLTALAMAGGVHAQNAKNDYAFDGVHITRESIRIKVGGSYRLSLRLINAGDAAETWESADEAIASVKDGEVFAHKVGETTVTVKKGDFSDTVKVIVTENDPAAEEYAHTAELLRDFLDLRFGMFLHFNSSTYEFADIGGDWAGENRTSTFDPADWNPSEIDCNAWAKAAKSAGMTFAVLTTKHHDGFNIWDSAYTDYDVGSATYDKDIIKLFTDACREEGIKPGLYFSMLDIKHRITSSSCTANDIEFIKAQIKELMTNYGEIPFIIFDAWNAFWGGPNYNLLPYEEIVNLVHTYQPNCLVINISCEANNVRSDVAMFESAAGQNVPDWFDNVNISCNTPSSHWFWCTKYRNETFKDADWVINQNVNKFRDSDTVFILNVSPDQSGQLISKYTDLLAEVGERYTKMADLEALPDRYLSDYDYNENLLFHKETASNGVFGFYAANGNAVSDRAVDGFCDYTFSHETASKSADSFAYWSGDIGYREKLGKLYVHTSSDSAAGALNKTYVFLLNEDPGRTNFNKLNNGEYVAKLKLTDGEKNENCYTLDFKGAEGRYVVFAVEGSGALSFSEIVLNRAVTSADRAYSLREKFATLSYTAGSTLSLPESALFVTKNGALVKETITWNTTGLDLNALGTVTVYGRSESGCEVSLNLQIASAGSYVEVEAVGVQASSMWDPSSDWANAANLIDKSGLTLNTTNILYSTHDNAYNANSMWHSAGNQTTGWLIFDLGKVTKVTNALIWNHNQYDKQSLANRGIKDMKVYYTDKATPSDGDWVEVGRYTLTKAGAVENQGATDLIAFGSIEARKIKFEILSNYGHPEFVGCAEVIFLADKSGSALDTTALNTALSAFEMASRFDYSEASYNAAKSAYTAAVNGKATAATQSELDALTEALNSKLTAMKATYAAKTPLDLNSYVFRINAGEGLPKTLLVKFSDKSEKNATVIWNALPAEKVNNPGSFAATGVIEGTPYTVTAAVVVSGVSRAALQARVDEYSVLDTKGYTAESVSAFTKALAEAGTVLSDSAQTQESINAAKDALVSAKYALTKAYASETPIVPPGTDTPPITNTPTTTDTPATGTPVMTDTPTTTDTPATGTPVTTDTPTTSVDPTNPVTPGEEDKTPVGLIVGIVIAAVVVIGAAVCVTVIVRKKKKG